MKNKISLSFLRVFTGCFFASLASLVARGGDSPAPTSASEKPLVLEPFAIKEDPLIGFGISLQIFKNNILNRVSSMTIMAVRPGSQAERLGVVPFTQIESINGKAVQEFTASFAKGSELHKAFVNRSWGDRLVLEIRLPGTHTARTITLTETGLPRRPRIEPQSYSVEPGMPR